MQLPGNHFRYITVWLLKFIIDLRAFRLRILIVYERAQTLLLVDRATACLRAVLFIVAGFSQFMRAFLVVRDSLD
jgi:hypothetical protein